ncbi:bifunctional DNA primase/polymerase [Streptomyces filamentosus]|uniref:bifunctional DNA primase/polymerase n=1 Tax=Streptomyces filamentosus TaxID=67294 RepID=UPI0027E4995E|nr:bifunctional DNA primase/polymerase [Streptomyces filamentosus]
MPGSSRLKTKSPTLTPTHCQGRPVPVPPADQPSTAMTGRTSLEAALWLARQGYPVHPLVPQAKTPAPNCTECSRVQHAPQNCPCHSRGGWCHGFHAATTHPETIRKWWTTEPRFGTGVACGPAGLVVIDIDTHSSEIPGRERLLPGISIHEAVDLTGLCSGFDTLALLAAYRKRLNPADDTATLRVRTPSGGMHIWYRTLRSGPQFRSSSGSGTKAALAWQVDIRAASGYIVAPGTRTRAGQYQALPGARKPALLPLWLVAELTRTGHSLHTAATPPQPPMPSTRPRPSLRSAGDGRRVLDKLLDEVRACGTSPAGMAFTEKLNRAAFTAGGLAQAGHLDQTECRNLLLAAATQARPHQNRRNTRIVDTGLRAGTARPIHPKERT